MGLLKLTESERLEILTLHNNARVIKEQVVPVVPASSTVPTAATTMDRKTLVTKIQDILKTKYNADLGPKGADGVLGPKTLAALTTAMANKTKAAPAAPTTQAAPAAPTTQAAPAAPTTQAAPAAPTTQAAPAAPESQTSSEVLGTEEPPQSNRNNRRARQDLRRGNRRAMQDLRAGQQGQQQ